ncbi:MAG: hypothetical protein GY947_20635 [Rhodobacteraceae bacterium]|nr:hypothetical protein [Paracoccaceae bacterium]
MAAEASHSFAQQANGSEQFLDDRDKLLNSIFRLTEIIEAETAALKKYELDRLNTFTRSKSQALLEFTRLENDANAQVSSMDVKSAMEVLRHRLVENFSQLKLHMRAAQEISEMLTSVALDESSDGTYSSRDMKKGYSEW